MSTHSPHPAGPPPPPPAPLPPQHNGAFVREARAEPLSAPARRLVVVTCMDYRLNSLLPKALGLREGEAYVVKNAGAVITHPFGGITRSVFVALYELNADEVFVIGHRDCGMTKLNSAATVSKMVARGITRQALVTLQYSGANVQGWLSGFDSVEDSIYNSVDVIRNHPLCPLDVPVHGLIIDPVSGKLELIVDGYKELPVLTGGVPMGHSAWLESMPPMSPALRGGGGGGGAGTRRARATSRRQCSPRCCGSCSSTKRGLPVRARERARPPRGGTACWRRRTSSTWRRPRPRPQAAPKGARGA